jgi:transposase-like protein
MSTGKPRDPGKERFWRRMLAQRQRSGLSVRAFCEIHGLSEPRFHAWRRILQKRDAQAVRFVPVEIVPDDPAPCPTQGAASALELLLSNGRLLRIGTGFDTATLQRLLALLEEGRPC